MPHRSAVANRLSAACPLVSGRSCANSVSILLRQSNSRTSARVPLFRRTDRDAFATQYFQTAVELPSPVENPERLVEERSERNQFRGHASGGQTALHQADAYAGLLDLQALEIFQRPGGRHQFQFHAGAGEQFAIAQSEFMVVAAFRAGAHHHDVRRHRAEQLDGKRKCEYHHDTEPDEGQQQRPADASVRLAEFHGRTIPIRVAIRSATRT